MKRLFTLILGSTLCASLVLAQQPTVRFKGTVLDTAGMPIPKVQITVQNSAASFKAISDDDGKFQIDLPPGGYKSLEAGGGSA